PLGSRRGPCALARFVRSSGPRAGGGHPLLRPGVVRRSDAPLPHAVRLLVDSVAGPDPPWHSSGGGGGSPRARRASPDRLSHHVRGTDRGHARGAVRPQARGRAPAGTRERRGGLPGVAVDAAPVFVPRRGGGPG